jgi:integration host factor subunit beta
MNQFTSDHQSNRVTKQDIIRRVAEYGEGIFNKDAQALVDVLFREMSEALAAGDRIEIRGFGTFTVKQRNPRQARNPKTSEKVFLESRLVPYFRAGKELKDRLNKLS